MRLACSAGSSANARAQTTDTPAVAARIRASNGRSRFSFSELAEGQFLHPRAVVEEGQKVTARILNIDGPNRRLGLSLRGVQQANGNGSGE